MDLSTGDNWFGRNVPPRCVYVRNFFDKRITLFPICKLSFLRTSCSYDKTLYGLLLLNCIRPFRGYFNFRIAEIKIKTSRVFIGIVLSRFLTIEWKILYMSIYIVDTKRIMIHFRIHFIPFFVSRIVNYFSHHKR